MPRRISADVDMQILADLGVGLLHREIAEKYGVSASYVSKLSLGKKTPDVYVARGTTVVSEPDGVDLDALLADIDKYTVFPGEDATEKYIKSQIRTMAMRIKMLSELLKKYKGEQ